MRYKFIKSKKEMEEMKEDDRDYQKFSMDNQDSEFDKEMEALID